MRRCEFTKLVRNYPQSRYTPDAYVMIGEYYFDNNNAYKALLAYQKASRSTRTLPSTPSRSTSWHGATTTSVNTAKPSTP